MHSTNFRTIFACTGITDDVKEAILTEEEYDLITAIRNYRKSYPNGYPEILWYIEKLFNELLDMEDEK